MNYIFIPLIIFSLSFTANANSLLEKMHDTFYKINQQDNNKIRQKKPDRFLKPVRFKSSSIYKNYNGSIRYISGDNLEEAASSKRSFRSIEARNLATAINFLEKNSSILQIDNPSKQFTMIKSTKDDLTGGSRLRFEQSYQGLLVWPSEIGIHLNNNGNVTLMNGSYLSQQRRPFNLKPVVTAEMAQEKALNGKPSNTKVSQKPVLIIYLASARLAWKLELEVSLDKRLMIVIDALNGDILTEFNQIHNAAATGSGVDLLGQTRPLNLFEKNGQYSMVNTSKPMYDAATENGVILVYDWMNQELEESVKPQLIQSNNPNAGFLPDAVSAAYNLANTYDYYLERHQRNSLDGKGGDMRAIVRVKRNFRNAFWHTGNKLIYLGDGLPFAASLDVVAHELTHGVIEHTANLVYQNQSGALNEAFADIFGEMVEARQNGGKNDWLLGTNVGEIARSMSRPEDHRQPSKMSEYNYDYTPNQIKEDNYGVHINSGIINHAYYLFAQNVGIKDAEKIFYRALTIYLWKNSQFIDARLAVLDAAKDLFGANSAQVQKAAEAFDRVEITANTASTPPPSSFPSVQGEDALLFACLVQDGNVHVCRYEKPTDQEPVVLSQNSIAPTRIAVDGSGEMAAFITSQRDLCLMNTDTGREACLGMPGKTNSVAMSPDSRYFAFVLLDDNGKITPKITVVDMKADTEKTYQLYAPADSKQPVYSIVAADSMTFTASGLLLYDALNVFRGADGRTFQSWAIYALNVNTGAIQNVIQPDQGEDIGFPSLSKTSDNFLVFDVYKDQTKTVEVYTMNLNTAKFVKISEFQGQKSVPSYNGDDSAIVHIFPDTDVAFNSQLIRQPLAKDRITPQGQATTWLRGATFGTVYRRGKFVGPQSSAAYYDVRTSILKIKAITVPEVGLRQFDLKLINGNPLTFQLINNQAATETDGMKATMEAANNNIIIPRAELTELDGNTSYWKVNMNLQDTNIYVIPEGGLTLLQ
jgi:Zn-dependent metalloprotease